MKFSSHHFPGRVCASLLWDCVWSHGNYCSFFLWILIGKGIRWVSYGSLWMPWRMETTEFHSLKVVWFRLILLLWVNIDKKVVELSPSKLGQYVHARAAIRSVADVNWETVWEIQQFHSQISDMDGFQRRTACWKGAPPTVLDAAKVNGDEFQTET